MQPANVPKIKSLPDDWRDKDDVILHACFQLLKNFVDQEQEMIAIIDWKTDEATGNARAEIDFLYNWWLKKVDEENNLDDKRYEEENLMLKRLIDIRKYLWT